MCGVRLQAHRPGTSCLARGPFPADGEHCLRARAAAWVWRRPPQPRGPVFLPLLPRSARHRGEFTTVVSSSAGRAENVGNAGNAGRPSDRRRQRRRRQQRRRRRWRRGASTRARQQQRGDFRSTWQLLDQHRKDLHVNIATEQGDPPLLLARMSGVSGIIAGWFVGGVAAAGNGARQFVRAWRFRGRLSGKYAPRRRVRRYGVRLEGLTTSHTTSPSGTRLSKHAHRSTPSAACRLRGRASSSFVASSRSTASSSTSPPSKRRGNYLGTTLCDAKVSLEACYTKRSVPYLQKDCHQKSPWFFRFL